MASWEGWLEPNGWALVADGMGGHVAGEIASKLAVQCLAAVLPALATADELASAVEATNLALFDAMRMRPELTGMGTTVAGCRLTDTAALIFNVGDSRVYCLHEGGLQQLSEDHVVAGHMLTKCLGGKAFNDPVDPYVVAAPLVSDVSFLLCSDGVTDELSVGSISRLLERENPARALIEAAVSHGGRDNATAVVLRIRSSPQT
nr:protein phosphatase 2C domain-containing protein [uncultured Sphingomonas sp.]